MVAVVIVVVVAVVVVVVVVAVVVEVVVIVSSTFSVAGLSAYRVLPVTFPKVTLPRSLPSCVRQWFPASIYRRSLCIHCVDFQLSYILCEIQMVGI